MKQPVLVVEMMCLKVRHMRHMRHSEAQIEAQSGTLQREIEEMILSNLNNMNEYTNDWRNEIEILKKE